jgi:hypothetical protein
MEFKFNGKLTLDDFVQFNETHYKKYKYVFYVFLFVIVIWSAFPSIKNIAYIIFTDPKILLNVIFHQEVIFYFILFLVILFIIIFFSSKIKRLIYKRYYDSNKIMAELKYYNVTENIIEIKSESESFVLRKENINKILYDNDSIYIYFALNGAHIIKRYFFDNENEYYDLVKFIKEKYNGN